LIGSVLAKVFGTKNEREIKRLSPTVATIAALEEEMQQLSDAQLRAKTEEFKRRIREHLEKEFGAEVVGSTDWRRLRKYNLPTSSQEDVSDSAIN